MYLTITNKKEKIKLKGYNVLNENICFVSNCKNILIDNFEIYEVLIRYVLFLPLEETFYTGTSNVNFNQIIY